MMIMISDS